MASTSEIGARIIEAGASGNLAKLKEIRRKVGDVKEFTRICDVYSDFSTGRSVLHYAAEMGHFEICRFLIQKVKVYIDTAAYKRETALTEAAKGEHLEIVKFLVSQGAKSIAHLNGHTALHFAILKDNWELTEFLVIHCIPLDVHSVDGTPLQIAISRGNVKTVKLLLSHGAKPDFCYFILESPLICAIQSHSFECFHLLLKARADPNRFLVGFSPLSTAAKEGDTKFLKSLLQAGADPNSSLAGHVRPIEVAALAHNREGVEILFPLTRPIKHYPEWTVDCIMKYCHSELVIREREKYKNHCLAELDESGHVAMDRKNYGSAIVLFKLANNLDPCNPKWASKRSLCNAHEGRRMLALYDADECIRLEPRFPDPHHGGDGAAAAKIFKKFFMAGLAFSLEPHNERIHDVFRLAIFDYFAWLYLMNNSEEIADLSYFPKFLRSQH